MLATLLLAGMPVLATTEDPLVLRRADRRALERAIAEGRVETAPPRPGLSLWVRDAAIAFGEWLTGVLDRVLPGSADWLVRLFSALLYVLLALVLVILLIRAGRRWRRERSREPPPSQVESLPPPEARRPAESWEAELRRRLERGELAAAVEALWWWLASVLRPAEVEPSWTSRELIARAGRIDLAPQVRRLDRLIYGPAPPVAGDVRELFRDLREAVG